MASNREHGPSIPEKDRLPDAKKKLLVRSLYTVLLGRQILRARKERSLPRNSCRLLE